MSPDRVLLLAVFRCLEELLLQTRPDRPIYLVYCVGHDRFELRSVLNAQEAHAASGVTLISLAAQLAAVDLTRVKLPIVPGDPDPFDALAEIQTTLVAEGQEARIGCLCQCPTEGHGYELRRPDMTAIARGPTLLQLGQALREVRLGQRPCAEPPRSWSTPGRAEA